MEPEELTLEGAEQVALVLEDSSAKGQEGFRIVEKAQQEEILALAQLAAEAPLSWMAVFQVDQEILAEHAALLGFQAFKVREDLLPGPFHPILTA